MSIPSVDIKNLLGQLYLLGVNSWRKNQLSTNPVFLLACKLPFRIIYSYGNWYNMEEQKDEHFPWGCSVIWRLGLLSKTISSTYSSGVLNICLVDSTNFPILKFSSRFLFTIATFSVSIGLVVLSHYFAP